nr:MAG TPA: hypothetical protein [Caudoviricetes sp.]
MAMGRFCSIRQPAVMGMVHLKLIYWVMHQVQIMQLKHYLIKHSG